MAEFVKTVIYGIALGIGLLLAWAVLRFIIYILSGATPIHLP